MEKILKIGAEAVIFSKGSVVFKERVRKRYRIEELDKLIRKRRTRREAKVMQKLLSYGVSVPRVISVDEEKFTICMEMIKGRRLIDVFESMNEHERLRVCEKIGEGVAMMHSHGIIHGDLTTSNMILKDGGLFFIDFGLSKFSRRVEDMATDLFLLKEAMKAKHFSTFERCWKCVLSSYKIGFSLSGDVLKRLERIERRRRYK